MTLLIQGSAHQGDEKLTVRLLHVTLLIQGWSCKLQLRSV